MFFLNQIAAQRLVLTWRSTQKQQGQEARDCLLVKLLEPSDN